MIELLGIWISSIVISKVGSEYLNLKIYKDLADNGYKAKLTKEDTKEEVIQKSMLIPGYNLFVLLNEYMNYIENPMLIDQLLITDDIEKMTIEEVKQYNEKTTMFNAKKISEKSIEKELLLEDAIDLSFEENNQEGSITFNFDGHENIRVLKVTGVARKMTLEEKELKIVKAYTKVLQAATSEYETEDEIMDYLKDIREIDLHEEPEREKTLVKKIDY